MIDEKMENIYNIILSVFIGILVAISFDNLFKKPITEVNYAKSITYQ